MAEEEIRQAIASATGTSIEHVPPLNFKVEVAKIRDESQKVDQITGAYKTKLQSDPKSAQDKYEELHDIGKFILAANDKIQIHVPEIIPKLPDFMLIYEEQKIGVEHTRLMSEETKAAFKTAKYYIGTAHKLIAKELNHLSKTVNIFINYNENVIGQSNFRNRKFSSHERNEVVRIIAEFIKSELTGGSVSKPAFIAQVEITPNQDSRVDLELAESYFTQVEFSQLLLERIAAKETKANNYHNATNLNELWLLIIIDDINSYSGFNIESAKIPKIERSNFENIFLFEKFGGKIYCIFSKV